MYPQNGSEMTGSSKWLQLILKSDWLIVMLFPYCLTKMCKMCTFRGTTCHSGRCSLLTCTFVSTNCSKWQAMRVSIQKHVQFNRFLKVWTLFNMYKLNMMMIFIMSLFCVILRFPPRNVVKRHTVSPKTGRCSHCGSVNGNQRGYTSSSDV